MFYPNQVILSKRILTAPDCKNQEVRKKKVYSEERLEKCDGQFSLVAFSKHLWQTRFYTLYDILILRLANGLHNVYSQFIQLQVLFLAQLHILMVSFWDLCSS